MFDEVSRLLCKMNVCCSHFVYHYYLIVAEIRNCAVGCEKH